MIRGYAGGTFDLLHPGHINFLRQSRDRCDHLTVGLNTDEFAERYKRRPIFTLQERMEMVEACRYVDHVRVNLGDEDSVAAVLASNANLVFHGDDWTGEALLEQLGITEEWLQRREIEMVYIPYTHGVSTTDVLRRIHDHVLGNRY